MKKQLSSTLKIAVLGIILAAGVSYAAGTWNEPECNDPTVCNAPAPINAGTPTSQQFIDGLLAGTASSSWGTNFLQVFGKQVISSNPAFTSGPDLKLATDGDVGARRFCDNSGTNCILLSDATASEDIPDGASGSLVVSQICLGGICKDSWDTAAPSGGGLGASNILEFAFSTWGGSSCARISSGNSVYCSGYNTSGQLGLGDTAGRRTFTNVLSLSGATRIMGGFASMCAIMGDKTAKCWGHNGYGYLGDGTTANKTSPADVVGLTNVADIQSNFDWFTTYDDDGDPHTYYRPFRCALTTTGAVSCWGYNGYGQLGNGNTTEQHSPVVAISSGVRTSPTFGLKVGGGNGGSACAIMSDNRTLKCWGYNAYGQLGVGDTAAKSTPTTVSTGGTTGNIEDVQIAASNYAHSCLRTSTGEVWCWGYNGFSQVDANSTASIKTPTKVSGIPAVSQIAVSSSGGPDGLIYTGGYTCGVTSGSGEVWCWGYNGHGELANGSTVSTSKMGTRAPTAVLTAPGVKLTGVADIVTSDGGYGSVCARKNDGTVYCWGYNGHGELGVGDTTNRVYATQINGLSSVAKLKMTGWNAVSMTCATLNSGTSRCWGYNANGALGTGNTTNSKVPIQPQ